MLVLLFVGEVSLTYPVLASVLSGEFLLYIPCRLHFYLGSFSYTSRAGFIFMQGVSLTHPIQWLLFLLLLLFVCFLSGEFLLHISCCLKKKYVFGKFLLYIPCWVFLFFLSADFLLHISCSLYFCLGSFSYTPRDGLIFSVGSFSYTSRASFIFMCRVSLTHPMLTLFLCRAVSYTARVAFIFIGEVCLTHPVLVSFFIGGVCLTHPVLASFLSWEFLLHIPCWLHLYLVSFS